MPDDKQALTKRPRYFDGQYLNVDDFTSEQQYHIDRQRRLGKFLHVSGVLEGLVTTVEGTGIKIAPGTAIDQQGQQILLLDPISLSTTDIDTVLAAFPVKDRLVLSCIEKDTDEQTTGNPVSCTRRHETAKAAWMTEDDAKKADGVQLAKVSKNAAGLAVDRSVCQYSGVYLPSDGVGKGPILRSGGTTNPNRADLTGSLSITKDLSVTGNTTITGTLSTTGTSALTGNVGIGAAPGTEKLKVSGDATIAGALSTTGTSTLTGNVGIGTTTPKIHLAIGDDDTGLMQQGDGQLAIYTNNQERLRIGTDIGLFFRSFLIPGNGSINTSGTRVTSQNTAFSSLKVGDWIYVSGETKQITGKDSNSSITVDSAFSPSQYQNFFYQNSWFRISNDGNVGIGTNTPGSKLEVVGDATVSGDVWVGKYDTGGSQQGTQGPKLNFGGTADNTDPIWMARYIQSAAGSGRSNDTYLRICIGDDDSKNDAFEIGIIKNGNFTGTYRIFGNGETERASDSRLKTNVSNIKDALTVVENLRGIQFVWKSENQGNEDSNFRKLHFGVLAQEVETVIPQLVTTDSDGTKFVNYEGFIPILIEAIKAQQILIHDLRNKIAGSE